MSVAATFCATLVDEWLNAGVRHAVIAPGSRSTPIALALADRSVRSGDRPGLSVHIAHDERVAAFIGLGLGLGGVPAVVVCTSGTAAANLHPAIVEAGLSEVPMLVVTADRPPELRDVGAAQTIDQTHLFGRAVRWFHDPGVPDEAALGSWRSLARRSMRATGRGPVHLNLPFREPLVGDPELPLPGRPGQWHTEIPGQSAGRSASSPGQAVPVGAVAPEWLDRSRGLIIAGGRSGVDPDQILALSAKTGWPILADATSEARAAPDVITAFDPVLRHRGFALAHRPEVVVHVGRPPASKVLGSWLAESEAIAVQVGGPGTIDPDHQRIASCSMEALSVWTWRAARDMPWSARWVHANLTAQAAIDAVLDVDEHLSEPGVARILAAHRDTVDHLVVASSMPIRDLEWFGGPMQPAHANRGANGIDGTIATAVGLALHGGRVMVMLGDIAFLHDSTALIGLRDRGVDVRILVLDNDGGGIFSFLPQAEQLDRDRFEMLFGTPHGADLELIGRAHGIEAVTITSAERLRAQLARPGPWIGRIPSHRDRNLELHRRLEAAVITALDQRPS